MEGKDIFDPARNVRLSVRARKTLMRLHDAGYKHTSELTRVEIPKHCGITTKTELEKWCGHALFASLAGERLSHYSRTVAVTKPSGEQAAQQQGGETC